jgi:hypothetical protein
MFITIGTKLRNIVLKMLTVNIEEDVLIKEIKELIQQFLSDEENELENWIRALVESEQKSNVSNITDAHNFRVA